MLRRVTVSLPLLVVSGFLAVALVVVGVLATALTLNGGGESTPADPASPADPAASATPSAGCRVSAVIDGDTIEVAGCADAGRVRLLLVDTPELSKHDCYAEEAVTFVRELAGHSVVLERDRTDRDKYGRLLRYVLLDGRLFNEDLVRGGYAKLLAYADVKYKSRIAAAASEARANRRGLWGACGTGSCLGDLRITAMDKKAESVTISGRGELSGWEIVSARGAATQRYKFPAGFTLDGVVDVVSGVPRFEDTAARLWWTADTVWSNTEDDNALLYDTDAQLACEFDDGK